MKSKKIILNGEEQLSKIKKARLSDTGKKLNDVVKEFLAKKAKEDEESKD